MSFEIWIAYATTCFVLTVAPGPMNILAATYVIDYGKRGAAPIVPGSMLGDLIAISTSLIGVGVLISTSPRLFFALKLAGGLALLAMGLRAVFGALSQSGDVEAPKRAKFAFWGGFTLALLHPGGFVFFTSFVPQFLDAERPFATQAAIFTLTFILIAASTTVLWLWIADQLKEKLLGAQSRKVFKIIGGLLLIGFAIISLSLMLV